MPPDLTASVPDTLPEGTVTVGQLARTVQRSLATIPVTWVAGEVLRSKRASGPHLYFELVERDGQEPRPVAKVQALILARDLGRVRTKLAAVGLSFDDGLPVRVLGRLELWPPSGGLTLKVTDVDVEFSLGRLAADRGAVLRRLEEEGLAGRQRQLQLPHVPLDVLLVTSGTSAAYADFTQHLADSQMAFRTCLIDVRVQGQEAARQVSGAIRSATRLPFTWRPDVIVVLRGGGSRADLAAFDSEEVARAICESPIPVITGVGHQTDTSVADAVSYQASKTPTACAAALIDQVATTEARVGRLWGRAAHATAGRLARAEEVAVDHGQRSVGAATRLLTGTDRELGRLAQRVRRSGDRQLGEGERSLSVLEGRAAVAADRTLGAAAARLDGLAALVRACDPAAVLARGYSITRDSSGRAVTLPDRVAEGTVLTTTVAGGHLRSVVTAAPVATGPALTDPDVTSHTP